MKILKSGRDQQGWSIKRTCTGAGNGNGGCGAKLLVEQCDLFHTHHYDYGGGHDIYTTFMCPCCGVDTDLLDGAVPGHVSDSIPDSKEAFLLGLSEDDSRYKDCPTIMDQVREAKAKQKD